MSFTSDIETPLERKRRKWREAARRWLQRNPGYKPDPERVRQNRKNHYLKHREAINARTAAYQKQNRDKTKVYGARWRAKNKDYQPAWRQKNRSVCERAWRKWDAAHPDLRRRSSKAYRVRNPDYVVRHNAKRRSRTGADSRFDPLIDAMVKNVRAQKTIECAYCAKRIFAFHIDHIVPLSRGGLHVIENLCVACVPCNLSKGSKLLSEWKGPKKCV